MSRANLETITRHVVMAEQALRSGPISLADLAKRIGVSVKVAGRLLPALRKNCPVTQTHGKDGRVPLYSIGGRS